MTAHSDALLSRILPQVWDAVAGPEIAAVTLVSTFRDGELTVLVPSAGWAEQLEPRTREICDQLNHALLSPEAVTSIRWAQGKPEGEMQSKQEAPPLMVRRSVPAINAWPGDVIRTANDGGLELVRRLPVDASAILATAAARGDVDRGEAA